MEHEDDGDTNCGWCTWNNPQGIGKETGRLGNKRTNGEYPDNRILKVTVITIVIGAIGTISKGLEKVLEELEIKRRPETTDTTALLKPARIL